MVVISGVVNSGKINISKACKNLAVKSELLSDMVPIRRLCTILVKFVEFRGSRAED